MNDHDPLIDAWYAPYDNGQPFAVVALDEDANFIEIQYFNGEIDEITFEDWKKLDIEPCAPPESWSGALEMSELEDEQESVIEEWEIMEQEPESLYSRSL